MFKLLFFINDKANCSGCTACANVCPTSCIELQPDDEGFYYPYYDVEKCIDCKKCEKVCPIFNSKNEGNIEIDQFAVTARSKNKEIWHRSSSGGAFTEICKSYGDENTIIVGVEMSNFKALHSCVVGVDNIDKFRKSKYIESDVSDIFNDIKNHLDSGSKLIFTGAPCQIAGLRSFLKKDYKNLLLIDFICHGVGSPLVFKKYIEYVNDNSGKILKNYTFREKVRINGKLEIYNSKYEYSNGDIEYIHRDLYNQFFLSQLCIRLSCGESCIYRHSKRLSDITISDYKGTPVKNKPFLLSDFKNYSSIIINSQKGIDIFNDFSKNMVVHTTTLEYLEKINLLFFHTTKENPLRNEFFRDFTNGKGFNYLKKKYVNEKPQQYNGFKIKLKLLYHETRVLYNNIIGLFE